MLEHIRREANITYTENGAVTNATTCSDCLDLFAVIGAIRRRPERDITDLFLRAFAEDRTAAMRILFFARDVRGGLGERRVFRVILEWLAYNEPAALKKNIGCIAEYGRWDDLLCLLGTPCEREALAVIKTQLAKDVAADRAGKEVSLLAKWLPSVNTSNFDTVRRAKMIARYLGVSDAAYRKTLSTLRRRIRIIENNLREKDYTFDYAQQPSKAMLKYRKAFLRNDAERYGEFLRRVQTGEAVLHTGTLAPYELVEPFIFDCYTGREKKIPQQELDALNATWGALPDYCDGSNTLAVIDTSGSMYWEHHPMPAAVALSLGLYFAERNKGAFRDHFIEFSARPHLIRIKGETFTDRLRYICSFCQVANTDIEAVFRTVLHAAVKNKVPQSELPARLVIISDMEFDACTEHAGLSNFENAKRMYAEYGYRLPQLVFWNVCARGSQQPVTKNEQGVVLVSGCTPRLFSMMMSGDVDPYRFMMEVIGSERYAQIAA